MGQTKKRKPYLVCDACGVQVFVRGKEGVHRFRRLLAAAPMPKETQEILDILGHFDTLKRKLADLEMRKPIIPGLGRPDPDVEMQLALVRREISKLPRKHMELHVKRQKGNE